MFTFEYKSGPNSQASETLDRARSIEVNLPETRPMCGSCRDILMQILHERAIDWLESSGLGMVNRLRGMGLTLSSVGAIEKILPVSEKK